MQKKLNWVLLVDDNESDNFIHKRVIEKSGITDHIGIAENGQEALDFLSARLAPGTKKDLDNRPELIFLDINMPVMNGWEFLEEYQKLAGQITSDQKIILLTSSKDPKDIRRAELALGKGCFQYKPLTLEMISEIMNSHFPENLQ
jgi:CheY-like chemotaxis protein